MKIPLNQFEQHISEAILKRGLSYYENGYVVELEEITDGVYEAIVSGSEDYTVELEINEGTIRECTCSCPYDMGPVCKHIVAVLFYLQQDVLQLEEALPLNKSKEKTVAKKEKKKTITEQINEVLENISHDELKRFIREKAKDNSLFRNVFLTSYAHQNPNESKEIYIKQIQSILRKAGGREGFIYWNYAGSAGKQVSELTSTAKKQAEKKNFKSAIFICVAVMEEMTKALDFADDSNGDISSHIDFAFDLLFNISKQKLPSEIRILLFEYCISAFKKQIFTGFDWHLGVLNIASEISDREEELQQVLKCLDEVQGSEYEIEQAQYIKLDIIRKSKGEKEADKFIEQNLSNPNLRRELIVKTFKSKNYEKSIALAKDGIKCDEKSKPGLAKEWYDWLLKIAQAQNDTKKILEYARLLFIDNFRHEQDYYQLLKKNTAPGQWKDYLEKMINDIQKKRSWGNVDLIAKIYIQEKWFDRLLELIKQNASLNYIVQYEKFLAKEYSDELVALYKEEVIRYIKSSTGRNHYQAVCKYLRRMKKLGGTETVERIILDLRRQYPQRRALMDELNQV